MIRSEMKYKVGGEATHMNFKINKAVEALSEVPSMSRQGVSATFGGGVS